MKKISSLACLLFMMLTGSGMAVEYTLDDLYSIALKNSEKVKISEEGHQAIQEVTRGRLIR